MKLLPTLLSLAVALPLSGQAASTLLFGTGVDVSLIDPAGTYGDNLAGTPNVTAFFGSGSNALLNFGADYGDLSGVAYPRNTVGIIAITLTASGGNKVRVDSFDLGAWNNTADRTINSITVAGDTTFSQLNAVIDGTNGHTTITPNITGTTVTITINATNLGIGGPPGVESDRIGIDNLTFSQVIPEPSAGLLALLGGLVLVRRRK